MLKSDLSYSFSVMTPVVVTLRRDDPPTSLQPNGIPSPRHPKCCPYFNRPSPRSRIPSPQSRFPYSIPRLGIRFDKGEIRNPFQMLQTGKPVPAIKVTGI